MTRRARFLLLLAVVALLTACGNEVVVRITTRVYEDGSVSRRVEIDGRTSEGEVPETLGWLREEMGLDLADRDAWRILEESPGHIVAEAFVDDAADLPPVLAHETDGGWVVDRGPVVLAEGDGVVYRRWTWSEVYGDPYGPEKVEEAVDALLAVAAEVVRDEARQDLGRGIETAGAETFIRTGGRRLLLDILSVRREAPGEQRLGERQRLWAETLASAGMSPVRAEDDFWEEQEPVLTGWLRDRIAASLSTPDRTVSPRELTFLPVDGSLEEVVGDIIEERWGDEESFLAELGPHLEALGGFYDSANGDRYRFELRLELPGRLVRTNGTPTRDGVLWLLRGEDLGYREAVFEAESILPASDALRSLGAPRDLEIVDLLRLRDILEVRDPDGALRRGLEEARRQGTLDALGDPDDQPEELAPYFLELIRILDPEAR